MDVRFFFVRPSPPSIKTLILFSVLVEVEVLRKVSQTSKALHEEKVKMAKAATKGGKKGKTKVTLKMDKGMDNFGDDYGGGEYDDFM